MKVEVVNYDEESEALLNKFKALGVIVIVMGGSKGHGFSASTVNPEIIPSIPKMLRLMADDIDIQEGNEEVKS